MKYIFNTSKDLNEEKCEVLKMESIVESRLQVKIKEQIKNVILLFALGYVYKRVIIYKTL